MPLSTDQGEPKPLDFNVIGEPLNKLLIAMRNKLSREWPSQYSNVLGTQQLFVMHARIARVTYLSALYLGADKPPDPMRSVEFGASIPVLNRSLLDSLFTLFSF